MSDDYSSDTQAEAPDFMAGLQNLRNQDFPGMSPEALQQLKMDSMRDLYPGDPQAQQAMPEAPDNLGAAMGAIKGGPTQSRVGQDINVMRDGQRPRGPDWTSMMPQQTADNDIGKMLPKGVTDEQAAYVLNSMNTPEMMERLKAHDTDLHGFLTGLGTINPQELRTHPSLVDESKFTPQRQESLRKFLTSPTIMPQILKMMMAQ